MKFAWLTANLKDYWSIDFGMVISSGPQLGGIHDVTEFVDTQGPITLLILPKLKIFHRKGTVLPFWGHFWYIPKIAPKVCQIWISLVLHLIWTQEWLLNSLLVLDTWGPTRSDICCQTLFDKGILELWLYAWRFCAWITLGTSACPNNRVGSGSGIRAGDLVPSPSSYLPVIWS